MPLNAIPSECESQEFTFIGFNDQFQTILQVSTDIAQYAFTRTLTLYQYRKVISIADKLVVLILMQLKSYGLTLSLLSYK